MEKHFCSGRVLCGIGLLCVVFLCLAFWLIRTGWTFRTTPDRSTENISQNSTTIPPMPEDMVVSNFANSGAKMNTNSKNAENKPLKSSNESLPNSAATLAAVQDLDEKVKASRELVANTTRGLSLFTPSASTSFILENSIIDAIKAAGAGGVGIEGAKRVLSGQLTWIPTELPGNDSVIDQDRGRSVVITNEWAIPAIRYAQVKTNSSAKMFVCRCEIVVLYGASLFWAQLTPFAILDEEHSFQVDYFEERISDRSGGYLGWHEFETPCSIIDTFDVGEKLPWVGFSEGPVGSGDYFSIYVSHYDERDRYWKLLTLQELEPIYNWEYQPDRDEMTVWGDKYPDGFTYSVDEELKRARDFLKLQNPMICALICSVVGV